MEWILLFLRILISVKVKSDNWGAGNQIHREKRRLDSRLCFLSCGVIKTVSNDSAWF